MIDLNIIIDIQAVISPSAYRVCINHLISTDLLERHLDGICTLTELTLINSWYNSFEHEPDGLRELNTEQEKQLGQKIFNNILNQLCITDSAGYNCNA